MLITEEAKVRFMEYGYLEEEVAFDTPIWRVQWAVASMKNTIVLGTNIVSAHTHQGFSVGGNPALSLGERRFHRKLLGYGSDRLLPDPSRHILP